MAHSVIRLDVFRVTLVRVCIWRKFPRQHLLDTLIITVLDTVPPVLAYPTADSLWIDELAGETVPSLEGFVVDNCDTNADFDAEETVVEEVGNLRVLQRAYVASDACGNQTHFTQTISVLLAFEGCQNELACNYDPTANTDDGTCTYAEVGQDCDGNCLEDADGDGFCDPWWAARTTVPATC